MRIGQATVLAGFAFVVGACSGGTRARFCSEPSEVLPEQPFRLTVDLSTAEVAIGEKVHVVYHLTNASAGAVGACPSGWGTFHLTNSATRANRGRITASTGVQLKDVFRLPPGATLTWTAEVEIPDVGVGDAEFLGLFDSSCWLWSGRVASEPVSLHVVPHHGADG